MGCRRLPSGPVSSTTASQARRVEAESAEVTPLQVLPPMVPMFRIWGPPTWSTASPRTLMYFWMRGSRVMWEKLVREPMRRVPSSSSETPRSSSSRWMEMSSFPARFPSRICTSTSEPPAMIWASGWASRRATAS